MARQHGRISEMFRGRPCAAGYKEQQEKKNNVRVVCPMTDHIQEFRQAMRQHGLDYAGELREDGKLHRIKCEGDKDASAWYVLYQPNPIPAGAFGCWRRQISEKWSHKNGTPPDPKTMQALQNQWKEAERQRQVDEQQRYLRIAEKVGETLKLLKKAETHDYLAEKHVGVCGDLRINGDNELVIPLQDADGKVWSYQTIDIFGDKNFLFGGRVKGCFFLMQNSGRGPLVVCEGYATGASISEATGWDVACAMNCGNLLRVATDLRKTHKGRTIVLAADNDRFTKDDDGNNTNPGLTKAREAADAVGGIVAYPDFPESDVKGTDFNDLATHGIKYVARILSDAVSEGLGSRIKIMDMLDFAPEDDADCVLGNRYLCRGGSCVIVGETSAGKSSLAMQMSIRWAMGADFMGLRHPKKQELKSLIVQAENDVGDTAEMFQGILQGSGLIQDNVDAMKQLTSTLERNLVVVRDQTHIGRSFAPYIERLIEIHQPNLVWLDPLLSFFGDDINDQKAMSGFLRGELNPISERTGVVWMMLHHTGKPSKEGRQAQKKWSSRDFSYMGLGSSDLSNWARAIITVVSTSDDEFRLIFAKRGTRAGITDEKGNPATELHLAHSGGHICWKNIPRPQEGDKLNEQFAAFGRMLAIKGQPLRASDIIKLAAKEMKRGERTLWKMWDGGEGELANYFKREGELWIPRALSPVDDSD